jgi:hypothetical protein
MPARTEGSRDLILLSGMPRKGALPSPRTAVPIAFSPLVVARKEFTQPKEAAITPRGVRKEVSGSSG